MYGATMGTLEVLVNGTSLWSMSGDQGDQWNFAQVDLSAYAGNTNITIEFRWYLWYFISLVIWLLMKYVLMNT